MLHEALIADCSYSFGMLGATPPLTALRNPMMRNETLDWEPGGPFLKLRNEIS